MKLKLDENLSRHLKPALEQLGHDVSTAEEEGLLSKPDTMVAAAAKSEGRIVFTQDVEFADLRKYPPGSHPGIVLFRLQRRGPLEVNRLVMTFVQNVDLRDMEGCVVVVEPDRVRVRRPPAG